MSETALPSILLLACAAIIFARPSVAVRQSNEIPEPFLGNKNCRVVISELNIFPAGSRQFIELMRVCFPEPTNVFNLVTSKKYKLIFVDHSGFLIGICELKNEGFRRSNKFIFYTVGGVHVPNADMKTSDCDWAEDSDSYYPGILPDGGKYPVGVLLVYHPKGSMSWLNLKHDGLKKLKAPITADIERKLVPLVVDMYVYASKSPYTACDYFETFYDGYKRLEQTILRDWVPFEIDRTISRCNSEDISLERMWDPMRPKSFLLAKPTPGDMNDCQSAVYFRIEEMQTPREAPLVHFKTTPEYSCYITTTDPAIDLLNIITNPWNYCDTLKQIINEAEVGTPAQSVTETGAESSNLPLPLEHFELEISKSSPHIWTDCKRFPFMEWITSLRNSKNPVVMPGQILREDVCFWLEYIQEGFRCKLCNILWHQKILFDRPASPLLSAIKGPRIFRTGVSSSTKFKNKALIDKHKDTQLHQISLDYFKLFDAGKRGSDLHDEFYREEGPLRDFLRSTENLFTSVFQATRMNIPFYKFPIMAETLTYYKINIGHLYQNPKGARAITMSISSTIHDDFLEDLSSRQPEMSILIDTSTDVSSTAAVVIMFQTFNKDGSVAVKVYRILPAGKRETGQILFDIFQKALEDDRIKEYVQAKCIGFASDGGSNVRKFRRLLEEWTGRTLMTVHCYAHKLDLVLVHSWDENENLQEIDAVVNNLYRIFNSKSHKKKEMLKQAAQDSGQKPFELKRIVPTRWINSKRRAITTIITHWKPIVKAIEAVIADKDTTKTQRGEAKALLNALKDPSFVITMAFITDACDELASLSLELQIRGTTLIGKKERRQKLVKRLTEMRTTNGKTLQTILEKATRFDSNELVTGLEEFESTRIKLDGIMMDFDQEAVHERLITQRNNYISTVLEEIDWYFPQDATDNLDIFDPSKWSSAEIEHFGNSELLNANRELKWDHPPAEILQEWIDTKQQIFRDAEFVKWSKKTPEEFWIHFLNPSSPVAIPSRLQMIVKNLLVMPATTAEVERVFSLYTNTKTLQRYSLYVETVEAILRIRANGPKHPSDFDAPHFVRKFILAGHSRSNDETRGSKKRKHEGDDVDSDPSDCESVTEVDLYVDFTTSSESTALEVAFVSEEERAFREYIFDSDEIAIGSTEWVTISLDDDSDDSILSANII